ncbi:MAG: hypothetical protein EOM64_00475 [Erysipelotrichia bacterium]|nr:hypothetical protein [Erysipelotrichia bacterium]
MSGGDTAKTVAKAEDNAFFLLRHIKSQLGQIDARGHAMQKIHHQTDDQHSFPRTCKHHDSDYNAIQSDHCRQKAAIGCCGRSVLYQKGKQEQTKCLYEIADAFRQKIGLAASEEISQSIQSGNIC